MHFRQIRKLLNQLQVCFLQFGDRFTKECVSYRNSKNSLIRLKDIAGFGTTLLYQESLQKKAYNKSAKIIHLARDHRISHLRNVLAKEDLYSFQITTETCISLAAILEYIPMRFNGLVNVYPLSCMPGMATSAIIRPVINEKRIPYLDTPYDGIFQPGMEAAIRTFVYQAEQHSWQWGRATDPKNKGNYSLNANGY